MSAHGTHGEPVLKPGTMKWEIKSTAKTPREATTLDMWERHLAGTRPLGIIPIREDSTCVWGSIDVDEYDINLTDLVGAVDRSELPLVPCRSKSGGLHLFMFLAEPQPAGVLQAVLRDLAAQLGKARSEIFPKQTQVLDERGDVGNWMVMPYFGDTYGGRLKEQVGLRKTGAEMTAEEFCRLAESRRVSTSDLVSLGKRRAARAAKTPGRAPASDEAFGDGPPCLQNLATIGIAPGGQSNALLMMGIYFKKAFPADWKQRLEDANRTHLQPPGSAEGLASVMKSLDRKDYEYTCKAEPMVSHCNSSLCRMRRWGVGDGGSFPLITGLSKLDTVPPIWFVDVDNARIEANTEQLQNYRLFHRLCMESCHKSYMMMRDGDWLMLLSAVMANLTVIEAPPDVSSVGRFTELLTEFLTNRARGERREDILNGRPWEDTEQQRHVFRLSDFQKFLRREDAKELNRPQITQMIRKLGGGSTQITIKDHNRFLWFLPSDAIRGEGRADLPEVKGSPI